MLRVAWLTDLHLNFVQPVNVEAFIASLAELPVEAYLLGGDIAEAHDLAHYLNALDTALGRPIYFVLGNHDFYRGSIAGVRAKVQALARACPNLVWLPAAGVVQLGARAGLVGHDGWGDARLGDFWGLRVQLNDWHFIDDFAGLHALERFKKLASLGDEAAEHFRQVLPEALDRFEHVIVLTHVPPFREACWHQGRISDDDWLPHFTCKAVGDVLVAAMAARPDRRMTVLCGHTHGAGEADALPNLHVITGGAVYGKLAVQRVLTVD